VVELCVCIGSSCHLKGSYNVIQVFQQLIEEHSLHDKIDFKSAFCMRKCAKAGVTVSVDGQAHVLPVADAKAFFCSVVLPLIG
jgi:NADH:ubiquinone oxidoreductase subunit E